MTDQQSIPEGKADSRLDGIALRDRGCVLAELLLADPAAFMEQTGYSVDALALGYTAAWFAGEVGRRACVEAGAPEDAVDVVEVLGHARLGLAVDDAFASEVESP